MSSRPATGWYCANNGTTEGPYTFDALADALRRRQLGPDTLVWSEGMSDWRPARDVREFASVTAPAPPAPPPLPQRSAAAPSRQPQTMAPRPQQGGDLSDAYHALANAGSAPEWLWRAIRKKAWASLAIAFLLTLAGAALLPVARTLAGTTGIVLVAALILIALWRTRKSIQLIRDPAKHQDIPLIMARGDLAEMARWIEQEMGDAVRIGRLTITPSWFMSETPTELRLANYHDIVWIHVTTRKVNGIATSRATVAHLRNGETIEPYARSKRVHEAQAANLMRRAPWATTEYSEKLHGQLPQLVAEADARRARMPAGSYDTTPVPVAPMRTATKIVLGLAAVTVLYLSFTMLGWR